MLKDHLFINSANDIEKLIEPLKKHLGVSSFVYKKTNNDKRYVRLSNVQGFSEDYYNHELYKMSQLDASPDKYQSGFTTWNSCFRDGQIQKYADKYDVHQGVVLTLKSEDSVEHFSFGSSKDNQNLISMLLSNIDLLERFICHFKSEGGLLLEAANKSALQLTGCEKNPTHIKGSGICSQTAPNHINFLHETPITSLMLQNGECLSKREIECAQHLLNGKTATQIGRSLYLSPRTIESHLVSLKIKLNTRSKSELINALIQNGFQTNGSISLKRKLIKESISE